MPNGTSASPEPTQPIVGWLYKQNLNSMGDWGWGFQHHRAWVPKDAYDIQGLIPCELDKNSGIDRHNPNAFRIVKSVILRCLHEGKDMAPRDLAKAVTQMLAQYLVPDTITDTSMPMQSDLSFIKPLAWVEDVSVPESPVWSAGFFRISQAENVLNRVFHLHRSDFTSLGAYLSLDEAMNAGMEHHRTDVLSAIDPLWLAGSCRTSLNSNTWQVVPKEADVAMEKAAVEHVQPYHDISSSDWSRQMPKDLFRLAWKAMLEAAPKPKIG